MRQLRTRIPCAPKSQREHRRPPADLWILAEAAERGVVQAWLESGSLLLLNARTGEPVDADAQAIVSVPGAGGRSSFAGLKRLDSSHPVLSCLGDRRHPVHWQTLGAMRLETADGGMQATRLEMLAVNTRTAPPDLLDRVQDAGGPPGDDAADSSFYHRLRASGYCLGAAAGRWGTLDQTEPGAEKRCAVCMDPWMVKVFGVLCRGALPPAPHRFDPLVLGVRMRSLCEAIAPVGSFAAASVRPSGTAAGAAPWRSYDVEIELGLQHPLHWAGARRTQDFPFLVALHGDGVSVLPTPWQPVVIPSGQRTVRTVLTARIGPDYAGPLSVVVIDSHHCRYNLSIDSF